MDIVITSVSCVLRGSTHQEDQGLNFKDLSLMVMFLKESSFWYAQLGKEKEL